MLAIWKTERRRGPNLDKSLRRLVAHENQKSANHLMSALFHSNWMQEEPVYESQVLSVYADVSELQSLYAAKAWELGTIHEKRGNRGYKKGGQFKIRSAYPAWQLTLPSDSAVALPAFPRKRKK